MIQTAEKNSISSFPSYDRLHKHFFIGKNSKCQTNSTIQISSYSLKLEFYTVELQNRGNSLFSFRKRANVCLISEKRVFAHFVLTLSLKLCQQQHIGELVEARAPIKPTKRVIIQRKQFEGFESKK